MHSMRYEYCQIARECEFPLYMYISHCVLSMCYSLVRSSWICYTVLMLSDWCCQAQKCSATVHGTCLHAGNHDCPTWATRSQQTSLGEEQHDVRCLWLGGKWVSPHRLVSTPHGLLPLSQCCSVNMWVLSLIRSNVSLLCKRALHDPFFSLPPEDIATKVACSYCVVSYTALHTLVISRCRIHAGELPKTVFSIKQIKCWDNVCLLNSKQWKVAQPCKCTHWL